MTSNNSSPKIAAKLVDRSPKFDFYDSNTPHDQILTAEGRKFYVESEYMSVWSTKLRKMFEDSYGEKEIEIPNVKADDFYEMLLVMYPSSKPISDKNCVMLFKIATNLDIPVLQGNCWHRMYWTLHKTYDKANVEFVFDIFEVSFEHNLKWLMHKLGYKYFKIGSLKSRKMLETAKDRISKMCPEAQSFIFSFVLRYNTHDPGSFYDGLPKPRRIKFSRSRTRHDFVIVVEAEVFYVNSKFLAIWSDYFKTLFNDPVIASRLWVKIDDLKSAEFNEFLQVLYGRLNISYYSSECMFELAIRFRCPGIVQQFIEVEKKHGIRWDFFNTACKHNLEDVKIWASCVKKIKDANWFNKKIRKPSQELKTFIQQHKEGKYDNYELKED